MPEENPQPGHGKRNSIMDIIYGILIGIIAGIAGGLFGIGGGVVIIPALVLAFGFSQHMAQGVSVAAMLPPIGALAAYKYWKEGNVNWLVAMSVAAGFLIGGYFGASFANLIHPKWMKKIFGVFLIVVALQMIFKK